MVKGMQDENTDIYCAASTIERINRYMTIDYSLVIIDIGLSEKERVDMLYMMRAAKRTPILVLAERLNTDEKVLLLRAGADVCMEKPLDGSVCKAQANALTRLYQSSSKSKPSKLTCPSSPYVSIPHLLYDSDLLHEKAAPLSGEARSFPSYTKVLANKVNHQ